MALTNRILGWHEDAAVIAWWRSWLGSALRWLTPRRRRIILAIVSVLIGTRLMLAAMSWAQPLPVPTDVIGSSLVVIAAFTLLWLCFIGAARFASLPGIVRRHPQLTLHLLFWGFLLLLWSTPSNGRGWREVAVGIAVVWPSLLWRLGYLLTFGQRGKVAGTRFTDHLLCLFPWYGGFGVVGKGLDYLTRHEAHDEDALARSQLAGIKLLLLAVLWKAALSAINGLVYGDGRTRVSQALGGLTFTLLPDFDQLLTQGGDAPAWQSWASIYFELVRQTLEIAVTGHVIVGVLRLFGFNIFRNTYKPLLAETVVQFWGRFDYYFKEVLVDFFFLPTYAKRFRKQPALRMFAAVFAAAVIGNMYVHLLQLKPEMLVLANFHDMWDSLDSRLFYCLLLAIGIFVSMRREQRRRGVAPRAGVIHRFARIAGVWTFFASIRIWNDHPEVPFFTRTQFFLGLFGLA